MTTQRPLTHYLLPASGLVGLLGLSGGIYGLMNPVAFSTTLGIPVTSTSSPAIPFVSFAAARNLGSGITMLSLVASGNRKGAGIFLMSGLVTSLADAWVCSAFGAEEGKAMAHAVLGLIIAGLGATIYST